MKLLVNRNKAIDLETFTRIVLCRDRQARPGGVNWCTRKRMFVQDAPDCKVCVVGRAPK